MQRDYIHLFDPRNALRHRVCSAPEQLAAQLQHLRAARQGTPALHQGPCLKLCLDVCTGTSAGVRSLLIIGSSTVTMIISMIISIKCFGVSAPILQERCPK
jgi:hypothetical protein